MPRMRVKGRTGGGVLGGGFGMLGLGGGVLGGGFGTLGKGFGTLGKGFGPLGKGGGLLGRGGGLLGLSERTRRFMRQALQDAGNFVQNFDQAATAAGEELGVEVSSRGTRDRDLADIREQISGRKVTGVSLKPAGTRLKELKGVQQTAEAVDFAATVQPPPPPVDQQRGTFLRLDQDTGRPVVLADGKELLTTWSIGSTAMAPGQSVLVTTINGQNVMETPEQAKRRMQKPQAARDPGPTVPEALASISVPWMQQAVGPPVVTYSGTSIPDPDTSYNPGTFIDSLAVTVLSLNSEASATVTLYQDIKNDRRPSFAPELMTSLAEEGSGSLLGQNILRQTSYFADPSLDPDGPGGILPPFLEDEDAPALETTKQWERYDFMPQQKAFWKPIGGGRVMVVIASSVSTLYTSRIETRSQSLSAAYYVEPSEGCLASGFYRDYSSTGDLGYGSQIKSFSQSFSYYGFIVGWDNVEQISVDPLIQDSLRDCLDTYELGDGVPLWTSHENTYGGWTAQPFPDCEIYPSFGSSGPGPWDFYFPIIEQSESGGESVPGYSPL